MKDLNLYKKYMQHLAQGGQAQNVGANPFAGLQQFSGVAPLNIPVAAVGAPPTSPKATGTAPGSNPSPLAGMTGVFADPGSFQGVGGSAAGGANYAGADPSQSIDSSNPFGPISSQQMPQVAYDGGLIHNMADGGEVESDNSVLQDLADKFKKAFGAPEPKPTPDPTLQNKYDKVRKQNRENFDNPSAQPLSDGGIAGLEKVTQYADGGKVEHNKKNLLELKAAFDKFIGEESKRKNVSRWTCYRSSTKLEFWRQSGSGERFAKLENKLSHKKGVTDPGALAASIGRKKYGNAKMNKMAKAHMADGGSVEDSKNDLDKMNTPIPQSTDEKHIGDYFDNGDDPVSQLVQQNLPKYAEGGLAAPNNGKLPYMIPHNQIQLYKKYLALNQPKNMPHYQSGGTVQATPELIAQYVKLYPGVTNDQIMQMIAATPAAPAPKAAIPGAEWSSAGSTSPSSTGDLAADTTDQLNQLQAANSQPGMADGGSVPPADDANDPSTLQQLYNAIQQKYQDLTAPSYGSGMGDVERADESSRLLPVIQQGYASPEDTQTAQDLQNQNKGIALAGGPQYNVSQSDVDQKNKADEIAMGAMDVGKGWDTNIASSLSDFEPKIAKFDPDVSVALAKKPYGPNPELDKLLKNYNDNGFTHVEVRNPENPMESLHINTETGVIRPTSEGGKRYAKGGKVKGYENGGNVTAGDKTLKEIEDATNETSLGPEIPVNDEQTNRGGEGAPAAYVTEGQDAEQVADQSTPGQIQNELAQSKQSEEPSDVPEDELDIVDKKSKEKTDDTDKPDMSQIAALINSQKNQQTDLQKAQAQRDSLIAQQQIAKGATLLGAGIAGRGGSRVDPSEALKVIGSNDQYVNLPVQKYKEQIENQQNDPKSPMSQAARTLYKKITGSDAPDSWAAADLAKVDPIFAHYAQMQATNETKKQIAADRAQQASQFNQMKQIHLQEMAENKKQNDYNNAKVKAEQDIQRAKSKGSTAKSYLAVAAADRFMDLLKKYPNFDDIPPEQVALLNSELATMAKGGNAAPSDSDRKEISVPTLAKGWAHYSEGIQNIPVGAGQGKFIENNLNYIKGLRNVAGNVISQSVTPIIDSYQNKLRPEDYQGLQLDHASEYRPIPMEDKLAIQHYERMKDGPDKDRLEKVLNDKGLL